MGVISIDYGEQLTAIGTEHSLCQLSGVGIYVLTVDLSELIAAETLEIRISTTCRPGDEINIAYLESFTGVQAQENWYSIPIPLASGDEIQATIKQTAGSPKTFPWNMRRM